VQDFVRNLFFQLNTKNEAFIDLGLNNNYLAVKVYRSPLKPSEVQDYEVPIFRKDRIDLANLPWDISFQHLIPYIDGISHVKKIVYEVGMDIDSVKRSLKLLQFHGAILMTDVFKFTNVYKLHSRAAVEKLSNTALMLEMRQFAASQGRGAAALPTVRQMLGFLLRLQPSRTLQQILLEGLAAQEPSEEQAGGDVGASLESKSEDHVDASVLHGPAPTLNLENIDLARLLAFAQAHGIIRRVYEYPLYILGTSIPMPAPAKRWYSEAPAGGLGGGGLSGRLRNNVSSDALNNMASWRSTSATALDTQGMAAPPSGRRVSGSNAPLGQGRSSQTLQTVHEQGSTESKSGAVDDLRNSRSGSLPVPAVHVVQPATPPVHPHTPHDAASAGTSYTSTGNFIKDVGLRRCSFEPEQRDHGREQDRIDYANQASVRPPAIQTIFSPVPIPDRSRPTSIVSTSTATTTVPYAGRTLSRYNSRSKMTAAQNFLQMSGAGAAHSVQPHTAATTTASAASGVTQAGRYEVRDIVHRLNGKENIDALCCRYDLSYQEIVSYPGVTLIYK
jgi:hypothetical protein